MTRRNPGLLELKHGALIVLTFILAVTAGKEFFRDVSIKFYTKIVKSRWRLKCIVNQPYGDEDSRKILNLFLKVHF